MWDIMVKALGDQVETQYEMIIYMVELMEKVGMLNRRVSIIVKKFEHIDFSTLDDDIVPQPPNLMDSLIE